MGTGTDSSSPLSLFHPIIARWFAERYGRPTDVQARAWPVIADGKHALITAPTGSGKTLTAFLWAIDSLASGRWQGGGVRVLYVSPLKALNTDVRENLMLPLTEIRERFHAEGEPFPAIRVLTRSGDTPAEERRQMLRRPPEILITTPESLNILLCSRNGRGLLTGIATVILDEIHAVAANKRGTHLATAVEQLVPLSGEFQRIGLSATVRPLETVAEFIGGAMIRSVSHFEKRPVTIIRGGDRKEYRVRVCHPGPAESVSDSDTWWQALAASFREIIRAHRSTLFFTNSRRHAEKITRFINEDEPEELAYSHHGSLSREIRLAVEKRLKAGELRAIVATSSLELGIDIGKLDRVVLVQAPPAVSSALQRIGRAGHGVGETSTGLVYPLHGRGFVDAAVMARLVMERDIEEALIVSNPLDVLAQVLLAMTSQEMWDIDRLYDFIRCAWPYRELPRRHFDLVLDMLAGRYAGTRIRDLTPRVTIDRVDNTVKAKEGSARMIYMSGGTIPDRGYYDLRLQESRTKIGELDEEFVWERSIGDTFEMGTQTWRIQRITASDVEVVPTAAVPGITPFWKAEEMNRDSHLSEKIADFLEEADERTDDPVFAAELRGRFFMDEEAAASLLEFLQRQKEATRGPLPHRHHLLIEHFDDPMNRTDRKQVILHTLWGGRCTRPYAMALSAAWEERYGYNLECIVNNDCVLLMLPHEFDAGAILSLVTPENLDRLLREKLEKTGFFGARFRENAGRALLLPRGGFKKRLPLWLNRLRAKKLLDAVLQFPDFPLLIETWRTCLADDFDIERLKSLLGEIAAGEVRISESITAAASPFADNLIWKQTNTYMYEDDTPTSGARSSLSDRLIGEIVSTGSLRPLIPAGLIGLLEAKLKRTAEGYAPRSSRELVDWARERVLIPEDEWKDLCAAVRRDLGTEGDDAVEGSLPRLVRVLLPGASVRCFAAIESLPRITGALGAARQKIDIHPADMNGMLSPAAIHDIDLVFSRYQSGNDDDSAQELVAEFLASYGPVLPSLPAGVFGTASIAELLNECAEAGTLVIDRLVEGSEEGYACDRENLEILLRMLRAARRPSFTALDIHALPLFLAAWQGVAERGSDMEALQDRLERLFGYPAPASAWEEFILPARMRPYHTAWLDSLMQSSDMVWFGCGRKKISFAFNDERALFSEPSDDEKGNGDAASIFGERRGRYDFFDIARQTGLDSARLAETLWSLAWQGKASNDGMAALRSGILNDFTPLQPREESGRRPSRSAYNRWTSTRPLAGRWFALDPMEEPRDRIDEEEIVKDRVRQLVRRYGVIFRELLASEAPPLQWGRILRTLRLMELSGELLAGHFFSGTTGPQFASHEAFRLLSGGHPDDAVYWMNATDPASPCGLGLESLKGELPPRVPSNWLVYRGSTLVLAARRDGKEMTILAPHDDPRLGEYLSFFRELPGREFNPEKMVLIERVNEKKPHESEYAAAFREAGFSLSYRGFELRKRFDDNM